MKIDLKLLDEARRLGCFRTKKEADNQAFKELIQHRRQLEILELQGQVDYFEDLDDKDQRRRR